MHRKPLAQREASSANPIKIVAGHEEKRMGAGRNWGSSGCNGAVRVEAVYGNIYFTTKW